jgi:hypothetical protein
MSSNVAGKKGSKRPGNGGKRDGAGRPKGVPNRSTLEFRNYVRTFTIEAADLFVEVMQNTADPLPLRMEAANWLVERGHGKAVIQANIEHEESVPVTYRTVEEVRVALLEKGIDVQRIPLLVEDFRKQALAG